MHIVLIGLTGSGKTSLAEAIVAHQRDYLGNKPPVHISTGALARELSRTDTSTDLALQQGALAPEQAMRTLVRQALERADLEHGGWILDGFPRTVAQLVCLTQWSAAMPTYVFLDTPAWTCLERLTRRGRRDDNPEALERKLDLFRQLTVPMLDVLRSGGALCEVSANGRSVEDLLVEVESFLA